MTTTDPTSARHLADETNGLTDPHGYHAARVDSEFMGLAELAQRGGRVTRVRWLTEAIGPKQRIADISYVHGELPDGTPVHVNITGDLMCVAYPQMTAAILAWAKHEGVYAKALGLLDRSNWSILR